MATFYKGAAIGTHWHTRDSRRVGFTAISPATNPGTEVLIDHIATSTANSPYISLTRSYAVAWHYAVFNSRREPGPGEPAYIYEIEIDDSLPHGLNLFGSRQRRSVHILPQPLRGIVDLGYMEDLLGGEIPQPPNPGGGFSPNVELQTNLHSHSHNEMQRCWFHGYIPPFCVKHRF